MQDISLVTCTLKVAVLYTKKLPGKLHTDLKIWLFNFCIVIHVWTIECSVLAYI